MVSSIKTIAKIQKDKMRVDCLYHPLYNDYYKSIKPASKHLAGRNVKFL